jgi:hypothetical protein
VAELALFTPACRYVFDATPAKPSKLADRKQKKQGGTSCIFFMPKKKDAKASADATTVAAPASEATPTSKPPFAKSSRGPTPEAMAEFERLQQQPLINWRGVLMVIGVLAFSYFAQKLTMPEPPQPPSPFPPAHVTCYGEGVIEPKQQHSTATPTSMQSWVLEAGANGTVWAKKEDGAQHCYPHSSNIIDGVPHPPWLKQERVERLAAERETMLRAGDVLIASFPRSGTSWMEQIVLLLLNQVRELHARVHTCVPACVPARACTTTDDTAALGRTHARLAFGGATLLAPPPRTAPLSCAPPPGPALEELHRPSHRRPWRLSALCAPLAGRRLQAQPRAPQ